MIKIKLIESGFHTLFPYKKAVNEFKDIGVEIITDDVDSYDFALVDHQSFMDKNLSLKESTEKGLEFLSKITGDYILVDGQDSTSIIGSFEVFKESDALLLLNHSLYKDRNRYNEYSLGGRFWWGNDSEFFNECKYKPKDFDKYSDRIKLAGTNWLGSTEVKWLDYKRIPKLFDISAMFGHSHPECYEHGLKPSQNYYYNKYRKQVTDVVNKSSYMTAKLHNGKKVPIETYYQYLQFSKIILAPYGFGEMSPRDIESAAFGSILIKPDMSHIDSYPFIYEDGVTYIACKQDFSDLEEKIEYCIENFDELRDELVGNMRKQYEEKYHPHYLPLYTYDLLKDMSIVGVE